MSGGTVGKSWRERKDELARKRARERAARPKRVLPPESAIITAEAMLTGIPGYDPRAQADGAAFDYETASSVVRFFHEELSHVEGPKTGEALVLEPWQQAVLGNLFGWKRADGRRRYRELFLYVPRKNGKTAVVAGVSLFMLCEDPEGGPRIYVAAADHKQASLLYTVAARMVVHNDDLGERVRCLRSQKMIECEENGGRLEAISAEAGTKHGLNPSCAIVDELHAQPDRELLDVLTTAMGARTQPLLICLTTADYERESVCNDKLREAKRVRDNGGDKSKEGFDPSFLPVIYEAPVDADWTAPPVWTSANPNLGVSISFEYLERECRRAREEPSYQNTFRRLHLNVKTESNIAAFSAQDWDACPERRPLSVLQAETCYAGLDLSHTVDLTALTFFWPETHSCASWFWIPKKGALKAEKRDKVPYAAWVRDGCVELVEGDCIDPDWIQQRVEQLAAIYNPEKIGYDPHGSGRAIGMRLQSKGLPMVEVRQGHLTLSPPSKELERLILSRQLRHGGHPVLRWNALNVQWKKDVNANIMPDKQKSTGRIDGIAALVNAIGCSMAEAPRRASVYETRGVLTV